MQAEAACSPCAHSKPCHQATHICGKSIKTEKVLSIAKSLTKQSKKNFAKLFLADFEREVWRAYLNDCNVVPPQNFDVESAKEYCQLAKEFNNAVQNFMASGSIELHSLEENWPMFADSLLLQRRYPNYWQECSELLNRRQNLIKILESEQIYGRKQEYFDQGFSC